jgi:RNA-directed DNA polymerase
MLVRDCNGRRALVNTGESWPSFSEAWPRVLRMQTKLHRWAAADPGRVFDDLMNLVYSPDFLVVAWNRVRRNKGARTAGVDWVVPATLENERDVLAMLANVRASLKARTFVPLPVRERMIPKTDGSGRLRRLGIPAAADRLVQASLVLVLEPIFEADFKPVSYGFRPGRRAHDAIAEIHQLSSGNHEYHWVFEADIEACFDELSHPAIMDRLRRRIGDKRVLDLVRAFLKSGIMTEGGRVRDSVNGTPQGGIISPLIANVALSAIDEHFCAKWDDLGGSSARYRHHKRGGATYRIIRYADDFVIMVRGTREHADALYDEVAGVLAPLGLRLSQSKTKVVHIDEGFDFLGFHIQRRTKKGTSRKYVYTYPSKKALASIIGKVRALTARERHPTLTVLLVQVNRAVRGWCNYFRHGVSKATFGYLDAYIWRRVTRWLLKRHDGLTWRALYRRFLTGAGNTPKEGNVEMFRASSVEVTRYRWRGTHIPTRWASGAAAKSA